MCSVNHVRCVGGGGEIKREIYGNYEIMEMYGFCCHACAFTRF